MGRPRKYNGLSEEKRDIISRLVETYDIKSAADIQEALKDLLGGTIQSMLEAELDTQMQEHSEAVPDYSDSRNGYKPKKLKSSMGEIPISVPQDRNSDFEPQIVPKYTRDISEIEGKIISMYARGFSVRQISDQIKEIYGFDVSEGMLTAKIDAGNRGMAEATAGGGISDCVHRCDRIQRARQRGNPKSGGLRRYGYQRGRAQRGA